MLLSDDEIKRQHLVEDFLEHNFRPGGYDIRVGRIVTVKGDEVDQLTLPPSGVVKVISRENINMPRNIAALAMIKTGLCDRGILALNTGIAGPGYDGHLSTTLLNFSNKDFLLTKDEVFLRLVFHECYMSTRKDWPKPIASEDYLRDKKKEVINFSNKFLNLESALEDAAKPVFAKFRTQALVLAPLLALMLAAFAFAVTLGVNYSNRGVWSKEDLKGEILREVVSTKNSKVDSHIEELENEIQELKKSQAETIRLLQSTKKP
ncbi:MAG TPA: hypothetical protein VIW64_09420 [Pyrinomonadaceae bacterium]|jgi:deoxycytidine triphosphate deaminase